MADVLPNGIGGTIGDSLAIASPLIMSSQVWFVSSVTGNASYSGKDRNYPLATIAGAITAIGAADDHIIVCLDGHTEEVSTVITLSRRVTILGEGSSSGVPTVKLTLGHATANIFTVAANYCQIRNIRFRPPGNMGTPTAATGAYINTGTVDFGHVAGCKFEYDQYNDGPGVSMGTGADGWHFKNCTFESIETSTDATKKPDSAMRTAGAITGLVMEGCVFDGGTVGFQKASGTEPWAFDGSAGAITGLWVEGMSLLRGADFKVHASTVGHINPETSSGHSRVIW